MAKKAKNNSNYFSSKERISSKSKRAAVAGLLAAEALALSFFENQLPPLPNMPPGFKLGLSNIVTMYAVYDLGFGYAFFIVIVKAAFSFLSRGSIIGAVMSFAGGTLSLIAVTPFLRGNPGKLGLIGVGILGAVAHNTGQILVSIVAFRTNAILAYAPWLIVFGVGTGFITGSALRATLHLLKKDRNASE